MTDALRIEDVAVIGREPVYTPYGYVIQQDGTILSLTRQYYHGVACSILFPDVAKEAGIGPPSHAGVNVYDYQAFEHDNQHRMPVIRVSVGQLLGGVNVSKAYPPATPEQLDALRKVFKVLGIRLRARVNTEFGDFDAARCLKDMLEDESWREEYRDKGPSRLDQRRETRRAFGGDE